MDQPNVSLIAQTLVKVAKHHPRVFQESIEQLLQLIESKDPSILSLFWKEHQKELLMHDRKESRFVRDEMTPKGIPEKPLHRVYQRGALPSGLAQKKPTLVSSLLPQDKTVTAVEFKEQNKKQEREQERLQELGERMGQGYDIWTKSVRTPTAKECLVTIFPAGHGVRRQEPGGIHLVLPRGMTLAYELQSRDVFLLPPEQAEQLDDSAPRTHFFLDSSGVKREYALVYSLKQCPELYQLLARLVPS